MKLWYWFVLCTVLCWGAYVPVLHHGQRAFGGRGGAALRAFLFVGVAYFLVSACTLGYILVTKAEPFEMTSGGVSLSSLAGILGAVGAMAVVFALQNGGRPLVVAPLVFAGAPIMNTLVSMMWDKPARPPVLWFYVGIAMAGAGGAMVLRFRPMG